MPKGTILVVEDVDSIAQITRQCLESFGFAVSAMPSTGEAALAAAQENRPDLVLMDIGLPGHMDGIEVITDPNTGISWQTGRQGPGAMDDQQFVGNFEFWTIFDFSNLSPGRPFFCFLLTICCHLNS